MAQVDVVFCYTIDPSSIPAARACAERLGYKDGEDTGIDDLCDGSFIAWFSDWVEYSTEMSASEWDDAGGEPVREEAYDMLANLEKELTAAGVRVISSEIESTSLAFIDRAEDGIDVYEPNSRYAKFYVYDED